LLRGGFIGGQRISRLSENPDCDFVLLVLSNEDLEARRIYEAKWEDVDAALKDTIRPSNAHNKRRLLSISKFIAIGTEVWPYKPQM
jgi:hypothetical protein